MFNQCDTKILIWSVISTTMIQGWRAVFSFSGAGQLILTLRLESPEVRAHPTKAHLDLVSNAHTSCIMHIPGKDKQIPHALVHMLRFIWTKHWGRGSSVCKITYFDEKNTYVVNHLHDINQMICDNHSLQVNDNAELTGFVNADEG